MPVAASTPAAPVAPTAEPTLDFKSISEHLILWPTSVTVKTATTVPVLVDGKKAQDLSLEAGTVLQVSKVLADGSLEARAKGAKFEIKSTLTDFNAELGKRVAELVAKGTKFDSPYPVALAAAPAAPVAPAASAAPAAPVVVVGLRWPQLTLAQRVDVLFGIKPEPEAPAAPVAPAAAPAPISPTVVTAPAAVPTPVAEPAAPAAEQKAVEKGKDLDRKMNQLFK
jgi:2-oxoglutarate dehydrogenase E2 component (dihydrolipoamide succinyltransferase)